MYPWVVVGGVLLSLAAPGICFDLSFVVVDGGGVAVSSFGGDIVLVAVLVFSCVAGGGGDGGGGSVFDEDCVAGDIGFVTSSFFGASVVVGIVLLSSAAPVICSDLSFVVVDGGDERVSGFSSGFDSVTATLFCCRGGGGGGCICDEDCVAGDTGFATTNLFGAMNVSSLLIASVRSTCFRAIFGLDIIDAGADGAAVACC
jgi:hypothetical protein